MRSSQAGSPSLAHQHAARHQRRTPAEPRRGTASPELPFQRIEDDVARIILGEKITRGASNIIDGEPNLVTSRKSQRIIVGGCAVTIEIRPPRTEKTWTLEVVDGEGVSHVREEPLSSERHAATAALQAIEAGGPRPFRRGRNVIPFRKS